MYNYSLVSLFWRKAIAALDIDHSENPNNMLLYSEA